MIELPDIKIGSSITLQRKVSPKDTARNFGSGNLENLLSTPSLVALIIEASAKLVDNMLPDGLVSVGKALEAHHENPTILDETVSVTAEITKYDGNKVQLKILAYDEIGQIGSAYHERFIVQKKSLLKKANEKASSLENHDF